MPCRAAILARIEPQTIELNCRDFRASELGIILDFKVTTGQTSQGEMIEPQVVLMAIGGGFDFLPGRLVMPTSCGERSLGRRGRTPPP